MAQTDGESSSTRNRAILYPYTNLQRQERDGSLFITRGSGVRVYDDRGGEYLEGTSGLWCVSLGFSEERLADAADRQMRTLPFYHLFNQRTNEPAELLAERLLAMLPVPMARVFLANSGSEANDTAIKLVWYYNNAIGRPQKKKIIAQGGGYHGVTLATASLTGLPANHAAFDLPLDRFLHSGVPHHYRYAAAGEDEETFATRLADELEALIRHEGPETVAAFIAEPVQGGGGVIVPPRTYFEKVQDVLARHDVLLIADEIICGFGRTGRMFGSQTFGLLPDIMTFAKALSSSYAPISAVAVSPKIYRATLEQSDRVGVFAHGFTTGGHPVSCAVALETLKIYHERDIVGHVRVVAPRLQGALRELAEHPLVGEVRGAGLIAGIELVNNRATGEPFDSRLAVGEITVRHGLARRLIVRSLGDTIAICPPLVITEREIDELVAKLTDALDDTARTLASARSL